MDRKNKGKKAIDNFSNAVRVLLVDDDDKICHHELARIVQEWGCDVTLCRGAENALDRFRKDTSRFDIMIIERNLLDMEFLQKVEREMDLLVIAMPPDRGIEAMQNNTITIHGVLKTITMNFLVMFWQCAVGKNIRNPAEVQQPTNDVPEAKRQRFDWSKKDLHKIFTDCVKELIEEGIDHTPKKIMKRMEAKGVEGLTIDIVKSHNQKWAEKLKKVQKLKKEVPQSDMQGSNDKDGPSSVHVLESLNSTTQLPRAPTAMNISQPQIGAPQIMTQPSSSRQICNDLPGGQAFDDGTSINASTNLLANNPQNQDLDETMLDSFNDPDFYLDFRNEATLRSFFDEHEDGPSSVHLVEALNSATQFQPSSSRQICNDLPGGQAFDDGTSINASTNLLANNPQNQDLDESMHPPFDDLDFYCNSCNIDTIFDIDLWDN